MKKKKTENGSRVLRVLILEDNAADAELVVRELRRTKIDGEFLLVEDKKRFSEALAGSRPQVILSDFKLPGFDGLDALEMARQQTPDTPFIFVSGSIGEEKAIETLGLGASDYIFKDNLQRLGPAVRRVVADAELRLQKKKTDDELNRHVEQLRILAEAADRFVHINDLEEALQYLARTICSISEAPYLLLSQYDEKMQSLRPRIAVGFEPFGAAIRQRLGSDLMQMSFHLKDMRPDVFSDFISRRLLPVRDGLFGFFNGKTLRQDCKAIERLLAVNAIFTMGFSWENQLFGGVTLLFKTGGELKNGDQIEALVNLAAVAIKRLRTERSLRESEEKYRLITENTAETITILDMNLQFTYVSPSIVKLRGYTVEEAQAQTLTQVLTADSMAQIRAVLNEEMALEASGNANPKRSRTLELQEYCKDGSIVWVENSLSFLRDADGRAVGLLGVSKDISERKRVQEEILQQKAFLEKLIEAAPEGIAITDCPGRIMQVNSEFTKMFGFSSAEAVGKMINELIAPPGFAEEANGLTSASGSGKKVVLETVRKKKDGSLFNVSIIGAPIFVTDRQVAVYAIYRDITERKQAEELVHASLKEKEVLLQEIHHRVKNNLQIVSGLLTLQADHGEGKTPGEMFLESQGRIRTIALVHEKLYRSHNLAEIAFDEYLRALTEDLLNSHGAAGRIRIAFETESVLFSIEKAVPLGLIVNELVTNALKHAFPGGGMGEIRIGLHFSKEARFVGVKTESGTLYKASRCELTIADNGIGLPADFDPAAQKSLGMKLVSMLAMQLHAELKVTPGAGAEFHLLFSNSLLDKNTKDKSTPGGI